MILHDIFLLTDLILILILIHEEIYQFIMYVVCDCNDYTFLTLLRGRFKYIGPKLLYNNANKCHHIH